MAKTTAAVEDVGSTSRSLDGCRPPSQKAAATVSLLLAGKAECLIGAPENVTEAASLPVRAIFDDTVVEFLDELARSILADSEARAYPDVIAFALWCRRSTLARHAERYADGSLQLGRGLVFHVSPANVPIMFAYTLAIGLLSGNANAVRLPSRPFPEVAYLCRRIGALTRSAGNAVGPYVTCIRYDRTAADLTGLLSELCDVRVIWGGDSTVREIRKASLRPGASEMVFSDRYSIAVIDSEAWLACENKPHHIRGFYNDTYLNDHASCASPRLVVWLGDCVSAARNTFWGLLEQLVADRYQQAPAQTVGKLEVAYTLLAYEPNAKLCSRNVAVTRVWCDPLEADVLDEHSAGVFLETGARSLEAILPWLRRRCQTISYYGVSVEQLASLLREGGARGGDRVVPMGHTLDFSLTWDGYDTIRALSRKIDVVAATPARG